MGRERNCSRPSYFRGCSLTVECLPATEDVRVQLPAAAPISISLKPRTSSCSRASKSQHAWGSTRAACQLSMGSWQASNALALQASLYGGGTHRLHHFIAG